MTYTDDLPDPYLRQNGHGATHLQLNPRINDLRARTASLESAASALATVVADSYPHAAHVNGAVDLPKVATATPTQAYLAASVGGGIITTPTTQNVFVEWSVFLASGAYTLNLWHSQAPDAGIASISIDGAAALATKPDMYAAAPAVNTLVAITDVLFLTSGRHTVRFTGATKHASSSAYGLLIQSFSLVRTAALPA